MINGTVKYFYSYKSITLLIADLEIERSNNILKYGYTKYKLIRDKRDMKEYYSQVA